MAAGMPRVTARKAPQREPAAAHGAVPLQCLKRVRRAGGVKSTMRAQHRTHRITVTDDQKREELAHGERRRHCSISARGGFTALTRIRMSRLPRRSCRARNSSRSARFIRLRSTARGKTRLGTISPSLGAPTAFGRNTTLNPGRRSARPTASIAVISAVPRRSLLLKRLRTLKRSTERGLSHGAPESRLDLPACACVRETRECASCEPRTGEKCVSSECFL